MSSGCIRLTNEDITDLYTRVKVGTRVVVLPARSQVAAAGAPAGPAAGDLAATPSRAPSAPDVAPKRYKPEEILAKLRQVDALVAQGRRIADAIRQVGVTEGTYHRWRREFGDRAQRRREPEREAPETVAQGEAGAGSGQCRSVPRLRGITGSGERDWMACMRSETHRDRCHATRRAGS